MARPGRITRHVSIALGSLVVLLGTAKRAPAQEAWDAIYLGGYKVGYYNTKVEKLKVGDQDLLRVRYDAKLTLKRDKDTISIQQQYGTIEKPDGEVLKLETRVLMGQTGLPMQIHLHETEEEIEREIMA